MHQVLIVDADKEYADHLKSLLNITDGYQVMDVLHSGIAVLETIELFHPEIVIMDLLTPAAEGMYILNYIRCRIPDYEPVIYVLSALNNKSIIKTLSMLDINFFSTKPVSCQTVVDNLSSIMGLLVKDGTEKYMEPEDSIIYDSTEFLLRKIRRLLLQLGAFPQHSSTKCITDVIAYCLQYPQNAEVITKLVYPAIAKKHNITSTSVERRVRNTIELIQNQENMLFRKMFSYVENGRRVTNKEFIYVVTEYLQITNGFKLSGKYQTR